MSKGDKQLQREGERHSMRESRSFTWLKSPSGWHHQDSHPRTIRAYRVPGVSRRQVEWTAVIGAAAWTLMSREQSANKSCIKMVSRDSVLGVCVCVCVCVWQWAQGGGEQESGKKKKEKHIFQKCSFPMGKLQSKYSPAWASPDMPPRLYPLPLW